MKASFVIGFHTARIDNLLQTLRFLESRDANLIHGCELITICQDSVDCLQDHEYGAFKELCDENFAKWQHFNMALDYMQLPKVTNFGVDHAEAEKIILLESDRILPTGYFWRVVEQLKQGLEITTKWMLRLNKPCSDGEILAQTYPATEDHRNMQNQIGKRNMWSGNTAFMKSDFYKAGKMDESYLGYGWADNDMTNTMEAVGVKSVFLEEMELHLWHPSATYGSGDQKKMFLDNGLRFCRKWGQPLPEWFRTELRQHGGMLI